MTIKLDGRRALVTGGSSGIGAAIASALGEAGAKVGINYRTNPGGAQAVARRIQQQHPHALPLQADVSNPDAVRDMFRQMDKAWGGIDVLINNAGIDGERAFGWEAAPDAWRKVIEVNLFGAFYCAREALQRMVRQKNGVILSISSVHEKIAWSGYSAYTASKAGLGMMTRSLAQEAAPHGVRVLAVAPGAIKTPINKSVWGDPAGLKDLLEKIPLGRVGEPQDIANMVVVLVSDIASYVTGGTIYVDGGMTDYPSFAHGG
ncbi:MAG TPA: 3-oxoacyl-ACP reductase FabG [Candidatus Acidoferrum sp.]|nr:3-oxoacyl-ACP reductase FabG [Candidatus Acidoferrum sp.]